MVSVEVIKVSFKFTSYCLDKQIDKQQHGVPLGYAIIVKYSSSIFARCAAPPTNVKHHRSSTGRSEHDW